MLWNVYICKRRIDDIQLLRCFYFLVHLTTDIANVIELVGSSDKSWQDAAQVALEEAKKTIHGITGVKIRDMTAKVDPNIGNITEYHTAVKIAFGVEHYLLCLLFAIIVALAKLDNLLMLYNQPTILTIQKVYPFL